MGNTVYIGFLEIRHPKERQTVLVSGAVVRIVRQIAKCQWLKEIEAIIATKRRTSSDNCRMIPCAPEEVDCYFVGAAITLEGPK